MSDNSDGDDSDVIILSSTPNSPHDDSSGSDNVSNFADEDFEEEEDEIEEGETVAMEWGGTQRLPRVILKSERSGKNRIGERVFVEDSEEEGEEEGEEDGEEEGEEGEEQEQQEEKEEVEQREDNAFDDELRALSEAGDYARAPPSDDDNGDNEASNYADTYSFNNTANDNSEESENNSENINNNDNSSINLTNDAANNCFAVNSDDNAGFANELAPTTIAASALAQRDALAHMAFQRTNSDDAENNFAAAVAEDRVQSANESSANDPTRHPSTNHDPASKLEPNPEHGRKHGMQQEDPLQNQLVQLQLQLRQQQKLQSTEKVKQRLVALRGKSTSSSISSSPVAPERQLQHTSRDDAETSFIPTQPATVIQISQYSPIPTESHLLIEKRTLQNNNRPKNLPIQSNPFVFATTSTATADSVSLNTVNIDPEIARRVLNAVGMPQIEAGLLSVGRQISGFNLFLERLDRVFNAHSNSVAGKGAAQQVAQNEEIYRVKLTMELDFEDRAHEFETEIRSLREKLKAASQQEENQRENEQPSSESNNHLKNALKQSLDEVAQLKATIFNLEHEKKNLTIVINSKIHEVDSNSRKILAFAFIEKEFGQMNIIHKELDSLRTEYTTLQEVNSKNHTAHSVLQISHMTATQELSQVQQANEWLSRQLDRKAAEYSEYRTTKMREMQDLQHTCDVVRSEKGFFEVKCRSLGERLDAAEKRGFELMNQLSGAQEKIISDSQNFKNEITSQKRLIELYQEQVEDLSSRQEEHQEVLQEAQQMLDNMSVKLKASEAVAVKLEQSNQEKSAKIEELEKQLEIVNRNAIENVNGTDLSIISPAAQAANALQKSGKSFTQIYLDYIRVQDENIALKTDIMRLTENLNSVLNDINERAPILKQVNEDRKMLEKEVERLMEDLTESNDSRDKAVVLAKESKERMESLAIRNDSLEKESHDLGRQVQHLLHRLESHQAGVSSRALSPILRKSDPSSTTTSGRLISDRLVLFDNIADLQTQNQQLRGSLRTVSSALKTLEDGVAEKIEERARKEIEEMVGVVDELREELRLTHLKCENYMVERDELRTAATALEGSAGVNSSSVGRVLGVPTPIRGATFSSSIMSRAGTPVAIGSVGGGGKYFDSRMSISSLHDDFDEQRRDSVDEIKRLRELNNTLTRSKNELEIQTARMQIAVENCNERLRNLTDQLEDSKQEAIQLREQITAYMKQQSANESRFNEVSRQLSDSQNALEKISAEERLLREAKEALAVREASLSSENQSLTQRYNTTNDHLIRLQNMFDRVNIDSRENSLRVEEKIKGLEAQLGLVRAQLTASQDESRKNSSRYESNISDCRFQNERLTAELAEAVREREISKFEERRLAQHSADLISRLSAAEKKITELTNTIEKSLSLPESAQLRDTQSQILQVRTELQTTKDALEAQIAHTEQYKAIAESSEAKLAERLEEFNTTYDRFKAEMETKVQEIEAECNVLLARKNEAEERLQQTSRLLEESTIANQQETQEIKRNSVLLAAKVAELESAKKIAEESIQSLHDELSARNGHLTEARQAYERVVGVEAERIRSINLLKEDLKNERQEGLRYKEQMLAIEGESDSNKALWDASKLKFEEEITSLKKTIEELAAQNKIYHNEFEVISGRVSYQTENLETSDAITADEIERGRLELIRILRRDKDALSTECEVSKQSIERLQKQIDQLQLLLNESRSNLENERASKKDSSELESLHKELLSKIDRVNVLTESNSSLRHSNGELKHKNDALEAKLNASEAENRPLKEQNSTLLAEIDAFKSQVIKLETENSKLIGRANQILGKYNPQKPKQRIDPAEHQALKDQVAEAASKLVKADLELAAALNMTEELKRSTEIRIVALNTEITTLQEENKKLKEEAVSSATTWAEREVQLQKMIKDAEAKGKSKVTQANDVIKGKSDIINELNAKMAELKEAQTTLISANAKLLKDVETLNTQKSDIQSSYDSLTTKFHMLSSKLESSTIVGSEKKIEQSAASVSSIATPSSPVPKRPREEEPSVQVAQTATVEVLANIPQNIKQNEPEMKRAKFGLNPEASVFSAPPSTATSVNINLPTKIQKNLNAFASENVPILNPLTEVPIEPAVSAGAVVTAPEGEGKNLTNILQYRIHRLRTAPDLPTTPAPNQSSVIPPTQASTPIPSTQPLGGPKPSIDTTNSATLVNTPYNAVAAIPNNAALSNTPNSAGVAGFSNTPAPGTPVHIRPLRQIVRPSQPISVNQPIMQRVAVRGRGSGAGGNRQISISNSPNGHAPLTQQIQMPRGGGVGRPNHPNTPRPLPAPRQP